MKKKVRGEWEREESRIYIQKNWTPHSHDDTWYGEGEEKVKEKFLFFSFLASASATTTNLFFKKLKLSSLRNFEYSSSFKNTHIKYLFNLQQKQQWKYIVRQNKRKPAILTDLERLIFATRWFICGGHDGGLTVVMVWRLWLLIWENDESDMCCMFLVFMKRKIMCVYVFGVDEEEDDVCCCSWWEIERGEVVW